VSFGNGSYYWKMTGGMDDMKYIISLCCVGHCIFEPSKGSKSCPAKNKLLEPLDGSRNTINSQSWIIWSCFTLIL